MTATARIIRTTLGGGIFGLLFAAASGCGLVATLITGVVVGVIFQFIQVGILVHDDLAELRTMRRQQAKQRWADRNWQDAA